MAVSKRKQEVKTLGNDTKKVKLSKESGKGFSNQKKMRKNLVEDSDDDEGEEEYQGGSDIEMEDVEEAGFKGTAPNQGNAQNNNANGGNTNSNKSRESHAAQKKLANERKFAKPNADVIHRSKKIWERLRRKSHVPLDERKQLTDELFTIVTGRVKELVFKHDASRVIQTAVKYGSSERRQDIAKELKGEYVQLAESAYGKYLVVKLMHYGNTKTREMIIGEFYGHVRRMVKHKEACYVVDDAFREYATPKQKASLIREFYGVEYAIFKDDSKNASLKSLLEENPEKRPLIMKSLFELINQMVEKNMSVLQILHKAMLEYILNVRPETSEAADLIELIKEHLGNIAFSKDGAQVIMRCFAWGSAKDRKVMLKNLKPSIQELYADEHGHMVLLAIFDVVDDTVLVSKTVFPEIQTKLDEGSAATHAIARIPLLYPLLGRETKLMHPQKIELLAEIDTIRAQTSKKDPKIRQQELRKALSPALLKSVATNAADLATIPLGCQFASEVIIFAEGDKAAAVEAIAALAEGEDALENKDLGRMLKNLVQEGFFNNKTQKIQLSDPPVEFYKYLMPKIEPNLAAWATGGNSYLIATLLESERVPESERMKIKKILSGKSEQAAIKSAKQVGNKGTDLISNLLKGKK
ncbi:pumilio domain member 6 [Orbilia oligospora]|uniref:Pumilio domain member 6 n=1 Tax=Orbilia oligospora TaxID=2813651 RepID=A0A7C8NPN7_ORBOL|nr:pumilio domain member 6 [Orbilia oligospora]KAF3108092.1 pumilio domain member 6 [Orbilia oligospora]KAF3121050.1 pumilio domain member 6 [Orbilia oligospora]KAF3135929.1 pumilio domain member 6 [Orbilia oligospora]